MVDERDDRLEGLEGLDETDEAVRPLVERARETYNAPPDTPRDAMWAAIQASMEPRGTAVGRGDGRGDAAQVVSLAAERSKRRPLFRGGAGWAVAAAALLILGIGIGRMSVSMPASGGGAVTVEDATAMRIAAVDHLGRTESLLTLVKLDAGQGKLDPEVGPWARSLLLQTRLLLDAPDVGDPGMRQLLQDLELVLAQIVGVTGPQAQRDSARTRTELNLAVKGLEDRDVLPRIQAVVPVGSPLAGT